MARKYKISNGLAFGEQKDLIALQRYAKAGWKVVSFNLGVYQFEPAQSEEVQFAFDFQKVQDDEIEEYKFMFEESGWQHVLSTADFHLFKAPIGTPPIHTESFTKIERLKQIEKPAKMLSCTLLIICLLLFVLAKPTNWSILWIAFYISIVLLFPMLMTWGMVYINIRRERKCL